MSKRKLLLADDSVTIQKVVNLTFADEGIEVIAVGDGDSAMEKVAEISPDLIMADVNMPGLTGYEICERIRGDENLRRTPVILLVGSFEPFDEDEARRVGADDYLTKPFQSIRQLVNKVTVLLESQNGGNIDASSSEEMLEIDRGETGAVNEQVKYSEKPTEPLQYPDTSFDDEMIQTNHPSSYAFDETRKFAARETGDLEEVSQFESGEPRYEITEDISDPIPEETEETENISYQIKEEESEVSETNQNAYEVETNDDTSYEINDDVSNQTVSDDLENSLPAQIEHSETDIGDQGKDDPAEAETSEDISSEITDERSASDNIEEGEVADETISVGDDEGILEEKSADISEETKDYTFVSDEVEAITQETGDESVNEVSDKIEETESASEETVAVEPENDNGESAQKNHDDEIPLPEYASVLEFEDDDILQLPPIETESEEEEEEEFAKSIPAPFAPTQTTAFVSGSNSTVIDSSQISPELIDAIVAKVMERLSEKAVKEVAWEVVPQMTELIVTRMAEEKLK